MKRALAVALTLLAAVLAIWTPSARDSLPRHQAASTAGAWIRTPRAFLLDGAVVTQPRNLSLAPSLLDVVLSGSCLTSIAPAYRNRREWSVWGGAKRPLEVLLGMRARIHGFPVDGVGTFRIANGNDLPTLDVAVLQWCSPALTDAPELNVTFTLGSLSSTVTVVRDAEESLLVEPLAAACTLFINVTRFLTWARYMHAIGFAVVYGYYNGPREALQASLHAAELAHLVRSGRLVIFEWAYDYFWWNSERRPGHPNLITTPQFAAMSSCMARTTFFSWRAFLDDDEYPFFADDALLEDFLGARSLKTCVFLHCRWAAVKAPCPHEPLGASSCWVDFGAMQVADIANASLWQAPTFEKFGRTKYFLRGWAHLEYRIHFVHGCSASADEGEGGTGFLHIATGGHLSFQMDPDGFATWSPTDTLRVMLAGKT